MQNIIESLLESLPLGILPFILFLPLIAAFVVIILGPKVARPVTLIVVVIEFVLSVALGLVIDPVVQLTDPYGGPYGWQYDITAILIGLEGLVLRILLGVDGLSVVMLVLSNLVVLIAAISSNHIKESKSMYYGLPHFLQSS